MADFETETVLDVVVDEGSLRDARQTVEDGMSDVMVGVDASGASGGGAGGSGVSRVLGDQQRTLDTVSGHSEDLVTLAETRNDLLEELVEQTGGGGGGGLGLRGRRPGGGLGGLGGLGGILGILGLAGVAGVAAASGGDIEAPTIQIPDIPALDVPPIPEPEWAPVDVTVPDWLPLGVPEPDWLPGEQPTPTPAAEGFPHFEPDLGPQGTGEGADLLAPTPDPQGTSRPLDAAADTSGRIGSGTPVGSGMIRAAGVAGGGVLAALGGRELFGQGLTPGGGAGATAGLPVALPAQIAAREGQRARETDRRTWLERLLGTTFRRASGTTMATAAVTSGHAQNQLPSEKRGNGDVTVDVDVAQDGVTERDIREAMDQAKRKTVEKVRSELGGSGGGLSGGLSDPFR